MSRTGVGVRVMIDGNQLDDGCLAWNDDPPPGTFLRSNLILSPRLNVAPTANGWNLSPRWFGNGWTGTTTYGVAVTDVENVSFCARKTWTGVATGVPQDISFQFMRGNRIPVVPGQVVSVSAKWRPSWNVGTPTQNQIRINGYNVITGGTALGQYAGPNNAAPAVNAWQVVTGTWTIPDGVTYIDVYHSMYCNAGTPANWPIVGSTLDMCAPIVEFDAPPGTYFDGNTPDTPLIEYVWSGAQDNSASVARVAEFTPGGVLRTNLATQPFPYTGMPGGWNSNSGATYPTAIDATGGRRPGVAAMKSTRTTTSINTVMASWYAIGLAGWTSAARVKVIPGQRVVASVWVKTSIDARAQIAQFSFYNDAGTEVLPRGSSPIVNLPANVWVRVSSTGVCPSGATNCGIVALQTMTVSGNVVGGEISWATDAQYELDSLTGYFDGDMPGTESEDYSWTGTPRASTSVATVPPWDYPRVPKGVSADDGLSVTWGRSTTVDQPEPSTCSFRVVDDPGGATVLQTIKLGAQVDVYADAHLSSGTASDTFTDPSFDAEVRGTTTNAALVRTNDRTEAGGFAARIAPADQSKTAVVVMPPGTLQAEGTNPLAWIGLTTTRGGQTWTISARVWVPTGSRLVMRPVAYDGPYASAATVLPFETSVAGSGAWSTLTLAFAPGASVWIGFQFEVSGGFRWADVAAAARWADVPVTTRWIDYAAVWLDSVSVAGPGGGSETSVLVFSGRITDMTGFYSSQWDTPSLDITATDFLGDLGNRYVGDEPWTMEALPTRVTRILTLAARPGEGPVQVEIASSFTAINMSWDDVDHQPSSDLLREVAQSVDGVLWSASHPAIGGYIRLEDPSQRLALYEFAKVGSTIEIVPIDFTNDPDAPPMISACDILRDPVQFELSVADIATRVSVAWQLQTVDEDSNPTTEEQRVEVIDYAAEDDAGTRAVNLTTLLTNATDAQRVADQIGARLESSWRISGLAVADADIDVPDEDAARTLLLLLDGMTRGGQPLVLTDLPDWSPTGTSTPIYLEGGTYTFNQGGWSCDLIVSRASGQGNNAAWDDMPNDAAWTWDAFDPEMTWDDLRGVAAP